MKKEITWDTWEKSYAEAVSQKILDTNDLIGYSPSGAAEELRISRQRVHQLVNEDKLDQVSVIDKNGNICAVFITNNSVHAYKKADRSPGRKRKRK